MTKPKDLEKYFNLLKQHRNIAVRQLLVAQQTVTELDRLLSPQNTSSPFQLNDTVVSHQAPNKDKVGLVTKVTKSFIHIAPLDKNQPTFKKAHKNLTHVNTLPAFNFSSDSSTDNQYNTTSITSRTILQDTKPSPTIQSDTQPITQQPQESHPSTPINQLVINPPTRPTFNTLPSTDSDISSPAHILIRHPSYRDPSEESPSPNTARRIRCEWHIERGLHRRDLYPLPTQPKQKKKRSNKRKRNTTSSNKAPTRQSSRLQNIVANSTTVNSPDTVEAHSVTSPETQRQTNSTAYNI